MDFVILAARFQNPIHHIKVVAVIEAVSELIEI
jgi:hypothetical protein